MEGGFKQFKHWYVDKEFPDIHERRIKHKDKVHHIIYHWTLEKHPKKIDLLFELWMENQQLKQQLSNKATNDKR